MTRLSYYAILFKFCCNSSNVKSSEELFVSDLSVKSNILLDKTQDEQAVVNLGKLMCIKLMGTSATVFGATLGVAIGTVVIIGGVAYVVKNHKEEKSKTHRN